MKILAPAQFFLIRGNHEHRQLQVSMKILASVQFFLIRGNHEHRQLQINFSFKREIMNKLRCLGDDHAHAFWELINDTFDSMPVAGIIDGSIFTDHGGIPTTDTRIEEILKIPKILKDPEMESASAFYGMIL